MALAEKVVDDAAAIDEADFEPLRAAGLGDDEIATVVYAAAARCFFSKALDALGYLPDASYADLDPALREAHTYARPIEES
jgi:alkylhydroperoxidase family enzyme